MPAVAYALAMVLKIGAAAPVVEQMVVVRSPVWAARIEDWNPIRLGRGTHLVGRVSGHPTVRDGHRAFSTWIIGVAAESGLILTFSGQLYSLGRRGRAPTGADDDAKGPHDPAEAEFASSSGTSPRSLH
jgi:hypothetical protein